MVNRTTRRRTTRPKRMPQQIRQLHRAINFEPRRSRVPADPPAINTVKDISLKIDSLVYSSTQSQGFVSLGGQHDIPIFYCKIDSSTHEIVACGASPQDLYVAAVHLLGWSSTPQFRTVNLCIHKVCYWSATDLTDYEIALGYDDGYGSAVSFKDRGTATHRARCGVTLPYTHWHASNATRTVISVDPDPHLKLYISGKVTGNRVLGAVQISVTLRFGELVAVGTPTMTATLETTTPSTKPAAAGRK